MMAQRRSIAGILAVLLAAPASGQPVNEYHVKAAYVYNLAKFVEWPPQSFKDASEPIALCVLGQSPIRSVLADAVSGETIDGRKLVVRQLAGAPAPGACHILFFAASDHRAVRSILQELNAPGTLTVGETEDFLADGGAVNFKLDGDKVRIEINLKAAVEQKLRISPKLLSLARVVKR